MSLHFCRSSRTLTNVTMTFRLGGFSLSEKLEDGDFVRLGDYVRFRCTRHQCSSC